MGTPTSELARMVIQHETLSRYFTLREIKFTVLSLTESRGYETAGDGETSVNVFDIPVESRRPCCSQTNLNFVKHIWDTHMFSFYIYTTLILPSLEGVAYIKHSLAGATDGNRRSVHSVKNILNTCTEAKQGESVQFCQSVTARSVSGSLRLWREPQRKWPFRTFCIWRLWRWIVKFRFRDSSYVATSGQVSEDQPFP